MKFTFKKKTNLTSLLLRTAKTIRFEMKKHYSHLTIMMVYWKVERAEDIRLNRVLQHQKLIQKQRQRSAEQPGRTQEQQTVPLWSSPSEHVHQSLPASGGYVSPIHTEGLCHHWTKLIKSFFFILSMHMHVHMHIYAYICLKRRWQIATIHISKNNKNNSAKRKKSVRVSE